VEWRTFFYHNPPLPADRIVVKQVLEANPSESVFDRAVALSRVGGDVDLLKEIAVLFLDDYPKSLHELHQAVETRDARRLERTAHGLKGSVSNFGARPAVDAALQLETMGRAQKLVEVEQVLHTLELALAALRPELESL
jgi:two-component system sensor histidine kinase/response regulator